MRLLNLESLAAGGTQKPLDSIICKERILPTCKVHVFFSGRRNQQRTKGPVTAPPALSQVINLRCRARKDRAQNGVLQTTKKKGGLRKDPRKEPGIEGPASPEKG